MPRAYAVLGILQMLDSEFDEAIESVQKAVALDPNGADAQLNLAIVLTYAGKHAEALAAMERVLKLNPKPQSQVWDYYSLVLYMNHRYQEAVEALHSVKPDERSDLGHENLAMAHVRLGQIDEARQVVATYLKGAPQLSLAGLRDIWTSQEAGRSGRPDERSRRCGSAGVALRFSRPPRRST